MNIKDIEHMWKVASNNPNHDSNWYDPVVVKFAEMVAEAEREACAVMVEKYMKETDNMEARGCLASVAFDLRARGQA